MTGSYVSTRGAAGSSSEGGDGERPTITPAVEGPLRRMIASNTR
jgi:hypothetical protein